MLDQGVAADRLIFTGAVLRTRGRALGHDTLYMIPCIQNGIFLLQFLLYGVWSSLACWVQTRPDHLPLCGGHFVAWDNIEVVGVIK